MAVKKFDKYILRGKSKGQSLKKASPAVTALLDGSQGWSGIHLRIKWQYISGPVTLMEKPHTHDFEEFLIFLGNKPEDYKDFSAEIEISLGKEGETRLIDAASIVCLPKGLIHGPLKVTKVGKPILFADIYLSPEYKTKPAEIKPIARERGKSKYAKYILKEPQGEPRPLNTEAWGVGINEKILGADLKFNCNFNFFAMLGSHVLPDPPHDHACDEFLFLIPASYDNWPALGGEVEIGMGDEWEKQTITTAAVVCLPKGVKHCPVYMKVVDKPFYWGHVLPAASYASSKYTGEAL